MSTESTRQILAKVRQIEIRTKRIVTEAMAGAYHSVFKGQGIDFEEIREYVPGDDVRSIDWNVTAKMDTPFIKTFREERELTIMLLVDLSGSEYFGSQHQSKRELAAELASILAFSATKNNDKVGLILFTDQTECYIPAKKGSQHILRVIREILFFKPKHKKTSISHALDSLNKIQKRKAIVFLISDFLFPGGALTQEHLKPIKLTHQRHDLICVKLTDPREQTLPAVGIITLEDAENQSQVEIDTMDPKVRSTYEKHNLEREAFLKTTFSKNGIDLIEVSTGKPYLNELRHFFEKRGGRR